MNRFAKKLTATAAALAILLAVPAAAAPSFVVYADEEVQETEAPKTTKVAETTKPKETVKETKSASKPDETVKETEPSKPAETTKPAETSKPAETVKETEPSKPAETTKPTEPSDTSRKGEPEETTAPSEPSGTKESTEPEETKEPSETTAGETEPSGSSEPSETTEPEVTETIAPSRAAKKAARGQYQGITIDGNFSDWDSVVKYDFSGRPNSHVNYGALVWDGDYIYIYLEEQRAHSSTWSGPNNNGNFVIKLKNGIDVVVSITDKGQQNGNKVSVSNTKTGTVLTTENGGIQIAYDKDYYTEGRPSLMEIAIPASILPENTQSISFGYYLDDPVIKNVANPHPTGGQGGEGEENDGSKIKIDGYYSDWLNFPHQTIEYDTQGAHHNFADSHGAIYQKSAKTVYVHAKTNDFMEGPPDYYGGNQFLEITVTLAGRETKMVACLVDENGNINWNSSENDKHYAKGKYKFALFEQSGWHQTTNMNNIHPHDTFYGYQYLEVGDRVDETEFSIDTKALAKHLGLNLTQSAELKVLFHRVGREPLIASGISTGPVFTLVLTTVAAGSYYVFTRRKRRQA